jgi:hypothetical protein
MKKNQTNKYVDSHIYCNREKNAKATGPILSSTPKVSSFQENKNVMISAHALGIKELGPLDF